jgi:hypothetical protein
MAAILNTAAQRLNADTAGLTHTGGEPNPGQAAAATPAEVFHSVVHTASGALDALFRQEPTMPAVVSTAPEVPTTATPGPNGGLVPSGLSHLISGAEAPSAAPGPTMATAPAVVAEQAKSMAEATKAAGRDAAATGGHWLSTLRRRLGV